MRVQYEGTDATQLQLVAGPAFGHGSLRAVGQEKPEPEYVYPFFPLVFPAEA